MIFEESGVSSSVAACASAPHTAGVSQIRLVGDFTNTDFEVEYSTDGGTTWKPTGEIFSEPGTYLIELLRNCQIHLNRTSGTSSVTWEWVLATGTIGAVFA